MVPRKPKENHKPKEPKRIEQKTDKYVQRPESSKTWTAKFDYS